MQVSSPKETQRTREPVPAIVIGGFLGAGKTSLLNHLLGENHGLRVAVLVNDFGAVNIDAELIVDVEGETVSLKNGCICCSIRDDLVTACIGVLSREKRPDLVVIETSGISDPVQVAKSLMAPELRSVLKLDCILGVVDAEQLPHLVGDILTLARTQIHAADFVVLNKIDLVDEEQRMKSRALIREYAPGARILECSHGRIRLESIIGHGRDMDSLINADDSEIRADDHLLAHAFSTVHWSTEKPLSLPALRSALEGMTESVYRAKGILCLEELPGRKAVLQQVGRRIQIDDTEDWAKGETVSSDLVLIGPSGEMDESRLTDALEGCVGDGDETNSPILRLSRRLGLAPTKTETG